MIRLEPAATRESENVLSVRGLHTEFVTEEGIFPAVRDVSFDVPRGGKVGIVGESGSGKSALALSIVRLISAPGRITSGEVWLNGRNLMDLGEREIEDVRGRDLSLIFQDPTTALDPVKPIGHQIMEGLRRHQKLSGRALRDRAVQLLREVEVPSAEQRLHDYPHQYSGGMQQRVMIAIALANEPDLIVADEPTTALDVTTQAQVLDVLERLVVDHAAAVILITHNLGIVAEFCDHVHVMYAGRLVETAQTDDIFKRPVHPYTEALLESVPRPDQLQSGPLPSIRGFPPSLATLPRGCSFEPRCPLGNGKEICVKEQPPPISVGATDRVVAECHFAEDRWNAWKPGGERTG